MAYKIANREYGQSVYQGISSSLIFFMPCKSSASTIHVMMTPFEVKNGEWEIRSKKWILRQSFQCY